MNRGISVAQVASVIISLSELVTNCNRFTIHQIFKSMLQSEFFERTKVTLTAEQYGEVENIYNRLKMDKDEFCQLWLKNRDNKIIAELMDHILATEKKLYAAEEVVAKTDRIIAKEHEKMQERLDNLGRRIVANFYDDAKIYDAIEEEFTLDFIIKVKLENNMDLEEHERKHLIQKL
jgi:hypothetical protein